MFVRSVPLDGGAITQEQYGGTPATGPGNRLDTTADVEQALPCHAADADLWFAEAPRELERAKALCAACPIRAECLAGALTREEPWGVWGGEIFERGAVIPRKRPRGRPSKADLARDRAYAAALSA